jgi:hypothetical protein
MRKDTGETLGVKCRKKFTTLRLLLEGKLAKETKLQTYIQYLVL